MNESLSGRMWLLKLMWRDWLLRGRITLLELSELQKHSVHTLSYSSVTMWSFFPHKQSLVEYMGCCEHTNLTTARLLMLISDNWCDLLPPFFSLTSENDGLCRLKLRSCYLLSTRCHKWFLSLTVPMVMTWWVFSCCVMSVKSCSFIPSDSCHFCQGVGMLLLCFQQLSMFQVWTSVLLLVYEIECVRCCIGGHLALGRGKQRVKEMVTGNRVSRRDGKKKCFTQLINLSSLPSSL